MMRMRKCCVLLIFVCSAFLCGMEQQTPQKSSDERISDEVARLSDKIDIELLGVNTNRWGKAVVGALVSMYKNSSLTAEEAIGGLGLIASSCSLPARACEVFKRLEKKHWYFSYLVDKIVEDKIAQLSGVKGSTIDLMLATYEGTGTLSQNADEFIGKKVQSYYQKMSSLPLLYTSFEGGEHDIHCMPFLGSQEYVDTIAYDKSLISPDGAHVVMGRLNDQQPIIWNMQTGKQSNLTFENYDLTGWRIMFLDGKLKNKCVIHQTDSFLVTDDRIGPLVCSDSIHAITRSYPHQIVAFCRPTLESRMCQKALLNSRGNFDELNALMESSLAKQLTGFPRDRLFEKIQANIAAINQSSASIFPQSTFENAGFQSTQQLCDK